MEKTICNQPIDAFRTCQKRNCEHLQACSQKWQEDLRIALLLKEPVDIWSYSQPLFTVLDNPQSKN